MKRNRASELRAIAEGRLMLRVRNGVTVSRSMLAMIADEIDAAETRLAEVEKALEPFAEASAYHMAFDDERPVRADGDVLVKHLRAARRALEGGE